MLLEAGADLDAASNDKGTAYEYAQGLAFPPSARLTSYVTFTSTLIILLLTSLVHASCS